MEKDIELEKISSEEVSDKVSFVHEDLYSPEEKAYLRKLNIRLLPLVFLIVFIQFCDKSALSVAAVLGIMEDAGLSGSQFSWLGSIFYLGYLLCQVPNHYCIQRLPIGRYLGSVLIVWGVVMGLTAVCHTFPQLLGLRFLLGFFEGVTYPCIYITMNTLYRRSEQSRCWGFLGISTGMGTVFGVVIAYGLAHMDHVAGFRAWRWGYIVFGIATVLIGILTFFCLIDHPHHPLLKVTKAEEQVIEDRARDNNVVRNTTIKREQILEALKEPRLWLIFIANTLNCLQNGGLVTFSTLLVEGLGFSSLTAIILQVPNGVAAALFAIGAVLMANRIGQNTFTGIGAALVSLLGCVLMASIPGTPKLVGFYLTWAMTGVSALLQTLVSNNVSGYTKRVFYNGVNMVAMTIGNFCGPLMMNQDQAPTYVGAMVGFSITNVLVIVCFLGVYWVMKQENKRRLANPPAEKSNVYLDLTDQQDKNIIYKL
ncbi:major facilitator superfamily domain-containing protein [Gilbertella persicaria]|uniref:major facilitator superfamily domain-containing protein n=1 Tax=Gilbertella persicaria TaxID=101096 RepID=UPI0022210257|nr:major facilitator superfamily domain-containing protein [Gilbertella persicaria]KAI8067688.1 major facilitator superfamily domain-containing protein [Gilbertella persicaria]